MSPIPSRIVSLAPSNTEILCALGVGDRLVGVDSRSDYPEEVLRLPKVGRELDIEADRVAELRPDLVVASLSVPGMGRNLPKLEARGLAYTIVDPKSLGDVLTSILTLGEMVGRSEEAERLVAELGDRMERIAVVASEATTRPRVYWEWWPKPLITPGRRSWITDMLEVAGGANIFGESDSESLTVDEDMVFAGEPEVIVACWCGAEKLVDREKILGRRGWDIVPGVRDGRVHVVHEDPFGRPGPRLIDGLELLAPMVHPEMYEGIGR